MQPLVAVPAPFDWRSGPLGDFYQPTSGNPFLNKSSYPANSSYGGRLTHYTVREDLLPEGTSRTDLGYHYIATDPNGNPLDDNLDGVPNYLQDTNRNGVVDNGEVNWRVPFVDRDRDGLSDSVEQALGTNPNLSDTDGDGLNDFVEVRIGADPLPPENWSLNHSFGNRVITSQPSHASRQH